MQVTKCNLAKRAGGWRSLEATHGVRSGRRYSQSVTAKLGGRKSTPSRLAREDPEGNHQQGSVRVHQNGKGAMMVGGTAKDLRSVVVHASSSDSPGSFSLNLEKGSALREKLITLGFISLWYAVNVMFNLTNKSLYKSFPFPWTVSAVHVLVGSIYCAAAYFLGMKRASFGRVITRSEWRQIVPPASMHALGHIAANVSFAAVAISLSHTVKTLEPAFSAVLQWGILRIPTPFPIACSLVPIIAGVAMASAAELSFNWLGFTSAMVSNLTFGLRAVLSKQTMKTVSDLSSTALYAYTTVISLVICAPLALIMEGPALKEGVRSAVDALGVTGFSLYLVAVGLFYHMYNQFAFNTLARVSPVSHGVCNVIKRIIIIGSSVLFFGNILTKQTIIGTIIAIAGTAVYSDLQTKHKMKESKE
mmetsp:Transcript_6905/g.17667  ORF Transcript_6905/g.17667 Transcript_6905/m.17667 type:complete len:418 (-) Transcript_6905:1575-2828(-)